MYVRVDEAGVAEVVTLDADAPSAAWSGVLVAAYGRPEAARRIVDLINDAPEGGCRIVDTDNFGGDYPDERFLLRPMPRASAQVVADAVNEVAGEDSPRFWKVVDVGYVLQPGFAP